MLMFLLLLGPICCSNLLKIIQPKETLTFCKHVTDDEQYSELFLSRISQSNNLFFRVVPPDGKRHHKKAIDVEDSYQATESIEEQVDVEGLELPLERNVTEKLDKGGVWTIQLHNRGNEMERFSISVHSVMKINKGNEDIIALRTLLNQLQNAVEILGNENHYAKNTQATNIKDAERLNWYLNLLAFLPFITFLIAQLEGYLARQLVRPKGKRFKGLF
ncbi:uncharacterized protein VICG_01732 [Vittaforma corneae ATCC 50505]|uniref:GOLD domain-containing protein n=1 Tax=Vittaforma corneae (strain ATCC 50505) TaxID=993615 RepID=L2GK33_VITCO|nr:uncharacterized protein VICG_01732 [Vittaforma corneae ATCC 50505]ELA41243.1 hypothetical protein VICG_01732 [Vittaforma corneae ATCC 50505]